MSVRSVRGSLLSPPSGGAAAVTIPILPSPRVPRGNLMGGIGSTAVILIAIAQISAFSLGYLVAGPSPTTRAAALFASDLQASMANTGGRRRALLDDAQATTAMMMAHSADSAETAAQAAQACTSAAVAQLVAASRAQHDVRHMMAVHSQVVRLSEEAHGLSFDSYGTTTGSVVGQHRLPPAHGTAGFGASSGAAAAASSVRAAPAATASGVLADARRPKPSIDLVVLGTTVGVERGNRRRRDGVRKFWKLSMERCSELGITATYKFLVGDRWSKDNPVHLETDEFKGLVEEMNTYDDMLLLRDCDDKDDWPQSEELHGVSSTTVKVLRGIEWALATYDFKYLVRSADDAWFRPDKFYQLMMPTLPRDNLLVGRIISNGESGPAQENLNRLFFNHSAHQARGKANQVHPFPYGSGWAITPDLATTLALMATTPGTKLRLHAPEDWTMGVWLGALAVEMRDAKPWFHDSPVHCNPDFSCQPGLDLLEECGPGSVLVHKLNWDDLTLDADGEPTNRC